MEVARANNGRWQSGQSGNPSGLPGRPLGSRTAFSQGFTRDLAEVWQAKGKQAMSWTADNPSGRLLCDLRAAVTE